MSSPPQRLLRPWQDTTVDRLPSTTRWERGSSFLAVAGTLAVLTAAFLAANFQASSASLAASAAAWGFLAAAHSQQGSRPPSWAGLLPLIPLGILAIAFLSVPSTELSVYDRFTRVGALSGLGALVAGLHLASQRPETYRHTLVGLLFFGSFYVSMSGIARILTYSQEVGSFGVASTFTVLSTQHDLISLALACLAIGLGLLLEALSEGRRQLAGLLLALLPLALPLAASLYGSLLAAALFGLAVGILVVRSAPDKLEGASKSAIASGSVLTAVFFAHAWFQDTLGPASLSSASAQAHGPLGTPILPPLTGQPLLGQAGSASASSDAVRLIQEYGYGGILLISFSVITYLRLTCRFHRRRTPLTLWSWIACGLILAVGFWFAPMGGTNVAYFAVILAVVAAGDLQRRSEPSTAKDLVTEETLQTLTARQRVHALTLSAQIRLGKSSIPSARPTPVSAPSGVASEGSPSPREPDRSLDPPVRIMRRRRP